jgi:hypothetical protein
VTNLQKDTFNDIGGTVQQMGTQVKERHNTSISSSCEELSLLSLCLFVRNAIKDMLARLGHDT